MLNNKFQDNFAGSDSIKQTMSIIKESSKVVLITAGSIGKEIVPKIHDLDNVKSVVVFCGTVKYHKPWAEKYTKVLKVTNHFPEAISVAQMSLTNF